MDFSYLLKKKPLKVLTGMGLEIRLLVILLRTPLSELNCYCFLMQAKSRTEAMDKV